ncbi:hypothetical protein [Pseudomonas sp. TE24901]
MPNLEMVRRKFELLIGVRAVERSFIDNLEHELGLTLPHTFKSVANFFDGSGIYVLPLHQIGYQSPTNVLSETQRLRKYGELASSYLVLGEPTESLIVMDCDSTSGRVLWCDATDVCRLGKEPLLREPDSWASYLDFVEYLVTQEEAEQG